MKLSLNWLKDFVDIPAKYTPKELSELLTLRTCEVEGYENQGKGLEGVVIGRMLEFSKHPNADKLNVAKVDIGRAEPLNLIFGQMVTMNIGDRIPVAVAPTVLPTGIKIEAKELRGVKSEGMLCLEQELGMNETGVSILYFPTAKPGTPLAEVLGMDDIVFEVDNKSITHRPDLWGHYGMAREFSAFLDKKLKPLNPKITFPKLGPKVKVEIEGKDIAYRFLTSVITGIHIEESPTWLKKRLDAVGVRPVNNIVDITNYVMIELGYPMHAFDRKTVESDRIVVRYAKQGEILETLDHKKRQLSHEDGLITNGKKALGLAGVMGGLNSEISSQTTEIIIEVGNWNPVMIRKTAQRHGLRSDAAQRFEKGLDPEIAKIAFNRACELILNICKGSKLAGPLTDVYPHKYKSVSVTIDVLTTNKKIGSPVTEHEMISHLKALEFDVKKAGVGKLKVTAPSFRATKDINIEDDIVEEVARMYGYEKIVPILPSLPIKLPHPNKERILKNQARTILSVGLGFKEISHYSFYGISEIKKCLLPKEAHVLIENPLTEDQTHMRISLLPYLLKSAVLNFKYQSGFKLYEIGRTYLKRDYFPQEEKFICGIIAKQQNEKEVFYDALGVLMAFLERFGAHKPRVDLAQPLPSYAHPSKCTSVYCGNEAVAVAYEVHPQVLKNHDIEIPCAAFEINFTKLVASGITTRKYKPLPRFPGMNIDISTLIPKHTPVREITELIAHTDKTLISKINVIDIFEDKNLGGDKKSVTVRVLLQSPDRTLTDEEMKCVQEKIFKALQGGGFVIRGL